MVTFINMTPHEVNILNADNSLFLTIPPSGKQARLAVSTVEAGVVNGVRLSKTVFGEVQGLPEQVENTYIIVSQLVKNGQPDRTDLLVPAEVVRDLKGNIIGCKSLGL